MATPSTAYWVGADGNVYARSNMFNGVRNLGRAVGSPSGGLGIAHPNGATTYITGGSGNRIISDPNPPQQQNNNYSGGNSNGGYSGGYSSGGSAASYAAAQQQAAAAEAARVAQAEKSYNDTLAADRQGFSDVIGSNAGDYKTAILDQFNNPGGFKSQQANINNEGIQNELSNIQGMQDIRDMVNNGINGAGVVLDNDGSGTSSAGDAVARAYGVQARQQSAKVGSQFAQGQHQIESEQGTLNNAEDNFMNTDMPQKKADMISAIAQNAQSQLANLNYMATIANIPDRVNILQEMQNVKSQATQALSAFDSQLTSQRAANTPESQDNSRADAMKLYTAGSAPTHQFDYSTTAPAQMQNSGPAASPLPIYVAPQGNKDNTPPPTA